MSELLQSVKDNSGIVFQQLISETRTPEIELPSNVIFPICLNLSLLFFNFSLQFASHPCYRTNSSYRCFRRKTLVVYPKDQSSRPSWGRFPAKFVLFISIFIFRLCSCFVGQKRSILFRWEKRAKCTLLHSYRFPFLVPPISQGSEQ